MTLIEIAERLLDKYREAHIGCDMKQDIECEADEYGDGNAGEHEDYRAVEIAISEADSPGANTIYIQGGRAWSGGDAMEVVDFDVDGMDFDDLCNEADCAEGEESHYHYAE